MTPILTTITDTVHFVQGRLVNWLVVTDRRGVMLIDSGFPGDRRDVLWSVQVLGYAPQEVSAILLTHAHPDHIGTAAWFARTLGTPVWCHSREVAHARRYYREQVSLLDVTARSWRPTWAAWAAQALARGGLARSGIPTAKPFTAGVLAALPGSPDALLSPGHSRGHCSFVIDGVLASGDALVTDFPVSPTAGPQFVPEIYTHNQHECVESLGVLAELGTEVLAPGHGPLWRGPIRQAVDQALSTSGREVVPCQHH